MNAKTIYVRSLVAMLTLMLLLLGTAMLTAAQNPNPGVLPPQSHPHGLTYGQWAAKWWQWALGQPVSVNPLLDPTGANCTQGQSGHVWFLAGTFGGSAIRSCTIPTGTALFFPVVNFACLAAPGETAAQQQVCAKEGMDAFTFFAAEVDGVSIQNLPSYRLFQGNINALPIFDITLPEDNLLGLPPGVYGPASTDGIYLMLAPLRPGNHVIHFSVPGFLDVTYNLSVAARRP